MDANTAALKRLVSNPDFPALAARLVQYRNGVISQMTAPELRDDAGILVERLRTASELIALLGVTEAALKDSK